MQNQVALYLIFITGITLLFAAITGWELLLGSKIENKLNEEISKDELKKTKQPFLSYILHHVFFGFFNFLKPRLIRNIHTPNAPENPVTNHYFRNKRIFFGILGLVIIVLGIFALNSGKFI